MLYRRGKQDSLIFVGSETHKDILNGLQFVTKDMFRSDCPIFLPIEYSRTVEMKLDNNMVFYENHINGKYSLIDKFTVNGGPEMVMEIGTFEHSTTMTSFPLFVCLDARGTRKLPVPISEPA